MAGQGPLAPGCSTRPECLAPAATKVLVYRQHLIPGGAGQVPMFVLAQRISCRHCPEEADREV